MSAIATTTHGKIEGSDEGGLAVFRGIPYAAPPLAALRWMPPQEPDAWSGVLSAKAFRGVAPQPTMPGGLLAGMEINEPQSEDCLYLNVWTPGVDGARRPVMVWIHGGGFEIGSGSQSIYDGATLARRGDVVLVTINYRLGPLGFLRLIDITGGRIPSSGDEGLLDQVAALTWVRNNIASFGGDPGNVTIFGESAGGMSVGSLLGMPAARGLFHKAIPQSGAAHLAVSATAASDLAARILRKAGRSVTDVDALRSLSAEALLAASPNLITPDPEIDGLPFAPVIDAETLPRRAIQSVAQAEAAEVALLVGSTRDEWRLFTLMDPRSSGLDDAGLRKRIARRFPAATAEAIVAAYRASRGASGEPAAAPDLFSAVETDRMFGVPALRLARAQSAHQSQVYRYLFTWKSPAMGGILGSCHALELGFVFGTLALPGMDQFCGSGPAAETLARGIQDAWLAFARSGDPSCEALGAWAAFEPGRSSTMILDQRCRVESAPFADELRPWEGLPDETFAH